MDFEKILYGGDENDNTPSSNINEDNINLAENASEIDIYKPKLTRDIMSVYEYAGTITKLAKYLNGLPSLEKYVSDVEIHQLINPAELAFNLLNEGKFDAILDRGYERVSFSALKINPRWKATVSNYFKAQHDAITNEIVKMTETNEKA